MNGLLETINSLGVPFIDFAVPMLVQSSILIVVLLGLDLVLRKRISAVCRYWIWMIVLLKLILPPTLSAPTSPAYWVDAELPGFSLQETVVPERIEIVPPATERSMPVSTLPQAPFVDAPIADMSHEPGHAITEEAHTALPPILEVASLTWQGWFFLAWLLTVITLVLMLIQRTLSVGRLCAQSTKASADLLDVLEQCQRQMGVRSRISLGLSPVVASPAVCGLFRPTIVLPESLTAKLDPASLRAILLHELVHIKRGDLWMSLCQAVLQIVYVYHPLLWLANVKIRAIREAAVDEAVLAAMGEQAEDYPKTLVYVASMASRRPSLSLRLIGVVESKKALAHRIRRITSRPFPKTAKIGMVGLLGIIVVAALLLPMARAQKDESAVTAPASNVFTYEGQLELHKPLAVGMVAGTDDHPKLVRIEWVRFETVAAYSWGVTARVAWLPAAESSWRLRVELLDQEGRVLQHSRDEATVFSIEAGHMDQTGMQFADLKLDYMKFFGRSHARRFRVHLEPWQENVKKEGQVDAEAQTLEIQVVDQKNQSPLANAAVLVRTWYRADASPYENKLSFTDLQGRCRIELPRPGLSSLHIIAQKQGFAAIGKTWSNDGSWPVSGTTLANLPQYHVLELIRAGSAGGIVEDDQGQPLSAVEVRFNAYVDDPSGASGISRSVQTDAEGRWQVDRVPLEVERISIGLRHAEYGGDNGRNRYLKGQALRDAWAQKHVEILTKGLAVTGKVLNDRGEPVPLATVRRVARGFNPQPTLTGESGAFRWACMADVSAYYEPPSFVVEAPGYAPVWQILDLTQRLDGLEFRLTPGRRIRCRVVDTEGKPVVGARTVVHPYPENSEYTLWMNDTDVRGEFHIPNMPENDIGVSILKSGYIAVRDFVVGLSEDELVITIRHAMRVSGTVTDARSGRPIPNFEMMTVYATENGRRTGTPVVFTDGAYELHLSEVSPEILQLEAMAVGYEPTMSQEIKVDQGQRVIDFKLERSSTFNEATAGRPREEINPTGPCRFTGVVRDEQGNPVPGALVSIPTTVATEVTTDGHGAFAIRTMRVSGARQETAFLFVRHKERNLAAALELDAKAKRLDIELTPGAILSGRVTDLERKGVPGTEIILYFWHAGRGCGSQERMTVNAQGYYEIRAVPTGHRYSVKATAEGYGKPYTKTKKAKLTGERIEFETIYMGKVDDSISDTKVDVENEQGLELAGLVLDKDGHPVSGATVYLGNTHITDYRSNPSFPGAMGRRSKPGDTESLSWESGLHYPAFCQSGSDGRFLFNYLLPGKTDVWAEHPSLGVCWLRDIDSDAKHVELVLSPQSDKIQLSGRIVSADGKPVTDVNMVLYTARHHRLQDVDTTVDRDGRFEISADLSHETHLNRRQLTLICVAGDGQLAWRKIPCCSGNNLQMRFKQVTQISGRVLNAEQEIVPNARVRFFSAKDPDYGRLWFNSEKAVIAPSVDTDAEGKFTIGAIPLGSSVVLQVEHRRYSRVLIRAALPPAQGILIDDVQLPDGISVEGTIYYAETRERAKGMDVKIMRQGKTISQTVTDDSGHYRFDGISIIEGPLHLMLTIRAESPGETPEWEGQFTVDQKLKAGSYLAGVDFLLRSSLALRQSAWLTQRGKLAPGSRMLVLDDSDQIFRGKTDYGDTLSLYNSRGQRQWQRTGINTSESMSSAHVMTYSPFDKTIWHISENGLMKLGLDGTKLLDNGDIKGSALALDPKTGKVWIPAYTGPKYDKTLMVLDTSGKKVHEWQYQGWDIDYSEKEDCFWLVGKRVQKLNKHGEIVFEWPKEFPWMAVSVSVNSKDGSAWVLEARNFGVKDSQNRIFIFRPDGSIRKIIKLREHHPFSVRVDAQNSCAWVNTNQGIKKLTLDGNIIAEIPIKGFSISPEQGSGYVWVSARDGLYRLDQDGQLVWKQETKGGTQKWLCAIPD